MVWGVSTQPCLPAVSTTFACSRRPYRVSRGPQRAEVGPARREGERPATFPAALPPEGLPDPRTSSNTGSSFRPPIGTGSHRALGRPAAPFPPAPPRRALAGASPFFFDFCLRRDESSKSQLAEGTVTTGPFKEPRVKKLESGQGQGLQVTHTRRAQASLGSELWSLLLTTS